jgi:hypothetical protein
MDYEAELLQEAKKAIVEFVEQRSKIIELYRLAIGEIEDGESAAHEQLVLVGLALTVINLAGSHRIQINDSATVVRQFPDGGTGLDQQLLPIVHLRRLFHFCCLFCCLGVHDVIECLLRLATCFDEHGRITL